MLRWIVIILSVLFLTACSEQSVLQTLENGGAEGAMNRAQADANQAGQESAISMPSTSSKQPSSHSGTTTPTHLKPNNPPANNHPSSPTSGMKCHEVAQQHCEALGNDSKQCTYTYKKVCH